MAVLATVPAAIHMRRRRDSGTLSLVNLISVSHRISGGLPGDPSGETLPALPQQAAALVGHKQSSGR
eukprot:2153951-Alexandrium_andersonii.AAC.1